jgi:hypothetical protein
VAAVAPSDASTSRLFKAWGEDVSGRSGKVLLFDWGGQVRGLDLILSAFGAAK